LGFIDKEEYKEAFNKILFLAERKNLRFKAPYFTTYVVKQLQEIYGTNTLYEKGLKVYTTLDYKMQEYAEETATYYAEHGSDIEYGSSLNYTQAAIVTIESGTGYIRALVGGYDFLDNQFDHITQAHRQPGSAFKPFTYLTALKSGFSPGTVIEDSPVTYNTVEGPYSPINFTLEYLGPVTLRQALEKSINVVAVKLANMLGVANVIATARGAGIVSPMAPVLSLTLGASEVSPLEMGVAYCTFANGGYKVKPISILRIEDRHGTEIYRYEKPEEKNRVFEGTHIAALIDMMRGVVLRGTGARSYIGRPMAGKTGTTTDHRDAWFIGFIPQYVSLCWVGNSDNTEMNKVTGGWVPAQMWHDYMSKAVKNVPIRDFPSVTGMDYSEICLESGQLASNFCPADSKVSELFWVYNQPQTRCAVHSGFFRKPAREEWPEWNRFFLGDKGNSELIPIGPEKKDN